MQIHAEHIKDVVKRKINIISARYYSLIQTCILNNINPQKYLNYVFSQAHKMRREEVDPKKLLPQFIDKNLLA